MKAPGVIRSWKRFLAVGCSHGALIDPQARAGVLKFKAAWKPDAVVHLGDAFDLTAFRAGAHGSKDEAEPIAPDLNSGVAFLRELRPTVYMLGNHEDRLWRLREHQSAIVSALASDLVGEIESLCRAIRCELHPWSFRQCRRLGNYSFFHGTVFSENSMRDHAEMWGNCVFAHAHRAGMQQGRRADNPTGICVGTLMDIPQAEYAKARRATMAWSQGLCWGEYCDDQTVAWLHVQPAGLKEWVLPI